MPKTTVGILRAPDGARLEYDMESVPGHVTVYGADGVCKNHISGRVDDGHVRRAIEAFRRAHPRQRNLF